MNDRPSPTPTTPAGPQARRGPARNQRRPKNKSHYGQQMAEKQNFKHIFQIREEQLRKYYKHALRAKEQTGRQLVSLLESRLDNAVYRAGFATTRAAARQMSTHRLFMVNNVPVDVPSYQLKVGDIVAVRDSKRNKSHFANFTKRMQNVSPPSWITIDAATFSFQVTSLPTIEEANLGVDVQSIVEYFAR